MRILVCGGRDYKDQTTLVDTLDTFHRKESVSCVIHGNAKGADSLAAAWAKSRGIACEPYPAKWYDLTTKPVVIRYGVNGTRYNAAAGGIRNQQMLDEGKPVLVIKFTGGKGTADMVMRAKTAGVRVIEIP